MDNAFPHHGNPESRVTPWRIGVRAARANLVPGLILQVAALGIVVAYYASPDFHSLLQRVADGQVRYGVWFSVWMRVVTNGIIPSIFCAMVPGLRLRRPGLSLLFLMVWWGFMGANVHGFYALQSWLWGEEPSVRTVLLKTATDMLVWSPLYASPINAISHLWHDQNYSWHATRLQLGPGWYKRVVLPNQVPGWAFWIPCLLVLYCLPTVLQMAMAAVLGCFWALMCLQIALRTPARSCGRAACRRGEAPGRVAN
jgi:hypothetical protein